MPCGNGTLIYKNGLWWHILKWWKKWIGSYDICWGEDEDKDEDGVHTYKGCFKNDPRHGNGTLIRKSIAKYVGNFENDHRTGQGTY